MTTLALQRNVEFRDGLSPAHQGCPVITNLVSAPAIFMNLLIIFGLNTHPCSSLRSIGREFSVKAEQDLTLISNSPAIRVVNQRGKETCVIYSSVYTDFTHTRHYGLYWLLEGPDGQSYCFWLTVDLLPAEYSPAKFHYSSNNRILSANIIRHYLRTAGRAQEIILMTGRWWKMVGASYLLVRRCQVRNVIVFCDHVQC